MRARLTRFFEHVWYGGSPLSALLLPLAWVYALLLAVHRRRAVARQESFAVPVVVIGNLTVGGTGKTPLVIWLGERLIERGLRPGVVTRGYRGTASTPLLWVEPDSAGAEAGDEAVLIARRLRCPVVVGADRVRATRELIDSERVDVVISDDGLQHFALHRDCEIIVVDGVRGLGNQRLLPAGPLREHPRRLAAADAVLVNGPGWNHPGALEFTLRCTQVVQLSDSTQRALSDFSGARVHALAAIGNPERFFALLRGAGCAVDAHAWPDHAVIPAAALRFEDAAPVLITEKDAVKLQPPVRAGVWSVNVDVELSAPSARALLDTVLDRIERGNESQ